MAIEFMLSDFILSKMFNILMLKEFQMVVLEEPEILHGIVWESWCKHK